MDLGPHGFYIAAAYAVTALIVAGLILRAVLDHRAQIRALADFAERGVARRSAPGRGFEEAQPEPRPDPSVPSPSTQATR